MKKTLILLFLIIFVSASFAQSQSLMNMKTWAYQLQGINISTIAADTSFELIIIDYSVDGTDAGKFTPAEIAQVKSSGKKVISYLSIGEAEDYRYYWQSSWITSPPSWLGPENPDWAGNYKVKFWDPAWQNIIFSYTDSIINQGFDGIYLDIVDAYYYWMVENPQQPYADTLMMQFVKNLRDHVNAETGNSNFIIIPQNAEDIINSTNVSASKKTAYFNAVNAVGVEDVFCFGNIDEDNPFNPDSYRLSQLQEWLANNKKVFSIEYLTQVPLINQYVTAAHADNFVPYVCMRALDQLCPGIPAGILEQQENNIFSVIPDPSDGRVYINMNQQENSFEISILSSMGKLIGRYNSTDLKKSANGFILDLSSFDNGIYFISVTTKMKNSIKKIIVSH